MSRTSSPVSEIQLEANRANAKRSTGPRSAEGKVKSSRNATKFGIFSDQVLLPGEDQSVYESFRDGMCRRLDPRDELERMLADRVVLAAWKLRRAQGAERRGTRSYARPSRPGAASTGSSSRCPRPSGELVLCAQQSSERFAKYEAALERSMYRAIAELRKAQAERGQDDVEDAAENEDVPGKNEPISEPASSARVIEAPVAPAAPDPAPREEVICKNEPISPPTPGRACVSESDASNAISGDDPHGG